VEAISCPCWPRIHAVGCAHDCAKETATGDILSSCIGARQNSCLRHTICVLVGKVEQGGEARVDVAGDHWILATTLSDHLLDACLEVPLSNTFHCITQVFAIEKVAEDVCVNLDVLTEIGDLSSDSDALIHLLVELFTRLQIMMFQDDWDRKCHSIN